MAFYGPRRGRVPSARKSYKANRYPSIVIELALSINDLLYGVQDTIFLRDRVVNHNEG